MTQSPQSREIHNWPIDRLVFYARNPRKNDAAVDRMCAIRPKETPAPRLQTSSDVMPTRASNQLTL